MRELHTGDLLAGYRIDGVVGRGGMGIVYRATHLRLQRVDAVKVIAPELADEVAFRSRFERESQAAARLDHPNVIPIYAAGEDGGLLYIAMRLVEGADVRAMLRLQGRLNPRRAAEVVMAVAAALDAAHERGLVHRDVKPANILVSSHLAGEHVYLTDFGLAKVLTAPHAETNTGAFIGTTDYVSPEQVLGAPLDARSDVYSLGATLYHMLTGRVPYPAEFEPAKLVAHTRDAVPSVLEIAPDVPPQFETVVARAMAKLPDERFLSAGDLGRAALAAANGRSFSEGQGSVARGSAAAAPTTVVESEPPVEAMHTADTDPGHGRGPVSDARARRSWPWRGGFGIDRLNSRLVLGAAVALAIAAIVGTVVAVGGAGSARTPHNGTIIVGNSPTGITIGAGSVWVVNAGDGTVSRIDQQSGKLRGTISYTNHSQTIAAITIWHTGIWVTDSAANTIEAIDAVRGKVLGTPTQVDGHPAAITSARGVIWVANYDSNTVTRVDAASGKLIGGPIHVGRNPTQVAATDDGIWVTNAGDATISRIDITTGRVLATIPVTGHPGAVTVTRGDLWISDNDTDTVTRIDPGSGRPVARPIPVGNAPTQIVATPDGVWVANSGDGTVTWLDARTGRALGTIRVSGKPAALDVSDGVVWVATRSQSGAGYRGAPGKVMRIDASTGKVLGA